MDDSSGTDKAKQSLLRLLALRDRSEGELRQKLKGKGYDDGQIDTLLAEFKALGYINDASYTARQALYLAREKLYGNRRIETYLLNKGISRSDIRQALDKIRLEFPEPEAIRRLIGKKWKGQPVANDDKEMRRLAQHLIGKGYSPALIFETLDHMVEEQKS
ncbi:MAG: Regulatory protein RecX [Syntrophus sp. SKADARSKE-3]|nr:Regulatory protein RecX [Syntrophus sp. SKADARSKE-3]